jgi:hypothetical protein
LASLLWVAAADARIKITASKKREEQEEKEDPAAAAHSGAL